MKKLLGILVCVIFLTACAQAEDPVQRADAAVRQSSEPAATEEVNAEISTPQPDASYEPAVLYVLFINVGYGDAALIVYQGRAVMIDTGAKAAAPALFTALNYMGVTVLDAVFLTHTHADHVGGMEALGGNIPIADVYVAAYSHNKKSGKNTVIELCRELALPLTRLNAGDAASFGEGLRFEVLGPLVNSAGDDNDNSLVLLLTMAGRRLLFTGDMQFEEEGTLLDAGQDVSADVLKVGNHGNPDATSEAFGAAVSPSVAVISTSTIDDDDSANPRVIEALPTAEIYVTQDFPLGVLLCVDEAGTITVSSPAGARSDAKLEMALDASTQLVTITNTGAAEADLSGFVLFSERGGECFWFPAHARLAPGVCLTVSGAWGGGDYEFVGESKPWNTKKGDAALLYDAGGHLIARVSAP